MIKGSIIDSHVHIGKWFCDSAEGGLYDFDIEGLEQLIKEPLANGDIVEKMLISNLDCIFEGGKYSDEIVGNIKTLKACEDNSKFAPLAVCQPNLTNGRADALRSLMDKNPDKFIGLKFHPDFLPEPIENGRYDDYLKLATEKSLPCLFHCQTGKSSPEAIYELAKKYSGVPVILGHMGAGGARNHEAALNVLLESIDKNDAKLYADTSWVDWSNNLPVKNPKYITNAVKELEKRGAIDRLIFGTDVPVGAFGEKPVYNYSPKEMYELTVDTMKNAIRNEFCGADEVINKIFYESANKLFFKGTKP